MVHLSHLTYYHFTISHLLNGLYRFFRFSFTVNVILTLLALPS